MSRYARAASRNVVSGNRDAGVVVSDRGTERNRIQGNLIGPAPDGRELAGEGRQETAVIINRDARYNSVGAGPADALNRGGNRIAFHKDDGILLGGTARAATDLTDANPIRFNSITSNGGEDAIGLGINFDSGVQTVPGPFEADPTARQPFGIVVTGNDQLDGDTGPNNEQNFPLLESVHRDGSTVSVEGTLESEPSAEFALDLYANRTPQQDSSGRTCDSSDRGEGEIYLTTVTVRTNEAGLAASRSPPTACRRATRSSRPSSRPAAATS